MIIVPKKRIETELTAACEMSGRFVMEKLKVNSSGVPIESSRVKVAEFDNLITNQGLNRIGTNGDWLGAIQVGSGTAVPNVSDTGLQSFIAGATLLQASSTSSQASPPYFATTSVTRRFNAGAAAGNLSEVGIGWAATGPALFSRALILDGSGNPTTITVLSDEVLDVTYQLRHYPPVDDVLSNITITGVGTIAVTTRAAEVTSQWAISPDGKSGGVSGDNGTIVYSGGIGPVTGLPTGTQGVTTCTDNAYVSGSFQRSGSGVFGLNVANFNITAASVALGSGFGGNMGRMQFGFGTAIPKTSATTLTLNFTHAWARRTL